MKKPRVLITTVPFGRIDPTPMEILKAAGVEAVINPLGRKLREGELPDMIKGFDGLIAGTEQISGTEMAAAGNLKAIVRVGIGLDSVDLLEARERGISLAYTPDAPSAAVGELTIGLMVDLLRGVTASDRNLRKGEWYRIMGKRISEITIGIIGAVVHGVKAAIAIIVITQLTYAVAIIVSLAGVGCELAVVSGVGHGIVVVVGVAGITLPVAIIVILAGVCDVDAVVLTVRDEVAVIVWIFTVV